MQTNVALIGYGYWGPNLARNLNALPSGDLVCCCDFSDSRLSLVRSLYPTIRTTRNLEDVWADSDIDAVVIATPAATHFRLAKEALLAGKHVLVEKPLALATRDASALIELAKERQLTLMVGHTFEYNPAVLYIKKLIDEGQLGDVYYAYSTRVNLGRVQQDLNAMWSIAPHDISILLMLLGEMPSRVSARGASYLNGIVEDVVFINLEFPTGICAHVHASWLDPSKVRRMTIIGSKRMVVYDDVESEGKIKVYDKGVLKLGNGDNFGEYQYRLHSGDIHMPRLDMSEPLRNECAHFVECIQNRLKPRTDGENGLRVVSVLESAQQSMKLGGVPMEVQCYTKSIRTPA